ncbi:hypothetical protein HN958_02690 [Candidatus Falkowbacteria bacterium]|jgi:hypothetical protein|nr:hypothetical protein [Candidatus Falkowbacteria bacterium]MBT7007389.1 hypothetical protein [Candidatus Falkowbacteria bacterium]
MVIFLLILLLLIVFISSVAAVLFLIGLIQSRGVPYVPLNKKQLNSIKKYVNLSQDDKLVDLGCGDGRVLRLFEKQGVKDLVGYEINFPVCCLAWFKNLVFRSKVKVYYKNFNKVDLSVYNKAFCYLLPKYLERMKDKLDKEMQGSTVISYGFKIKGWQPDDIIHTDKDNKQLGRIFIYKI